MPVRNCQNTSQNNSSEYQNIAQRKCHMHQRRLLHQTFF